MKMVVELTPEEIKTLRDCLWGWGVNEGQADEDVIKEIDEKLKNAQEGEI